MPFCLSRIHFSNDLDEFATVSSKMRLLAELSRPKALKISSEQLTIVQVPHKILEISLYFVIYFRLKTFVHKLVSFSGQPRQYTF